MICPKCREYTSPRYLRCPHCGTKQVREDHEDVEDFVAELTTKAAETNNYRELRF